MEYYITKFISYVFKLFWIIPIKKNKIVFRSAQGKHYNCNPKYITEYLLKNHPNEFKIIWIFDDINSHSYVSDKGITICKSKSLAGIFHLCTAKFVVDNHGTYSYIPVRKKQITINTWHGGGSYKRSMLNSTKKEERYLNSLKKKTKYYISSCEAFSKNNLDYVQKDRILPFGMARNDLFFSDFEPLKNKVREHYNLPLNTGIILYAPTYRTMQDSGNYNIDIDSVISACEKRYNKPFVFAYNLHNFVKADSTNLSNQKTLCVNDYEDMQEMIAASDVVITDYSSIIWDAALAKKPVFIYASDIKEYQSDRDFYTPMSQWPFAIADSNEKLMNNILNFSLDEYLEETKKHFEFMGSYEDGNSAKRTYDFIKQEIRTN